MVYQWHFQPYRRRFKQALHTSHGLWTVREGIIVRLVNEAGSIGWGEIAPIPWFGSETLEQARAFCRQLPAELSSGLIFSIPDALPCCQFAFESAWEGMRARAIEQAEPQNRRDAEERTAFATENLTLRPQSLGIEVQILNVGALNSKLRLQNSIVAVPNAIVAAQNSETLAQNSKFSPQSPATPAQNSDIAVQNSKLRPQSLKFQPQSSIVAAQNSILQSQISTPDRRSTSSHPTPYTPHPSLPHSVLLPAGKAALHAWKPHWKKGIRTFKWKIGVHTIATEVELLHKLTQTLPPTAKLRLDANGGLSLEAAAQWLETCDAIAADPNLPVILEYLEQPLAISQFQAMQDLSHRYQTPIALDESVATLQQLQTCYANGWRGIFVIKPAIVGSPTRLRQFCQEHAIDAVFSSAFETAIGRQAGLQLAAELGNPRRAMGYGTTHWFDDADVNDFEQL